MLEVSPKVAIVMGRRSHVHTILRANLTPLLRPGESRPVGSPGRRLPPHELGRSTTEVMKAWPQWRPEEMPSHRNNYCVRWRWFYDHTSKDKRSLSAHPHTGESAQIWQGPCTNHHCPIKLTPCRSIRLLEMRDPHGFLVLNGLKNYVHLNRLCL